MVFEVGEIEAVEFGFVFGVKQCELFDEFDDCFGLEICGWAYERGVVGVESCEFFQILQVIQRLFCWREDNIFYVVVKIFWFVLKFLFLELVKFGFEFVKRHSYGVCEAVKSV